MIVKWQQEQLLKWVNPVYQNKVCYTMKTFSGFPSSVLLACTFFFVLLLLCSLLLHYISKWNPCQATLTIEIIRGQKGFFDTCGFILSYFKFGDFITLLWKIQYISNYTHSKGWLIFPFKANGIVRSVEESSSDAECRENSSQKVHFVTSHISEI